jgi:hypothetical protein
MKKTRSKKSRDTVPLKQYEDEFTVMDWRGNFPDLNIIENCWSCMKRRLMGKAPSLPPRSLRRPSRTCGSRRWTSSNSRTSLTLCPRRFSGLLGTVLMLNSYKIYFSNIPFLCLGF